MPRYSDSPPRPIRSTGDKVFDDHDQRWVLARRLLTDDTLILPERVAVARRLELLLADPATAPHPGAPVRLLPEQPRSHRRTSTPQPNQYSGSAQNRLAYGSRYWSNLGGLVRPRVSLVWITRSIAGALTWSGACLVHLWRTHDANRVEFLVFQPACPK